MEPAYPVQLMTSLATASGILTAVAGILLALVVSRPQAGPRYRVKVTRTHRLSLLVSIILGMITMILSVIWFDEPRLWLTVLAAITMALQFALVFGPLALLAWRVDK